MTLPDPDDKNAIGGAHPGTKNITEIENEQNFRPPYGYGPGLRDENGELTNPIPSNQDLVGRAKETKRRTDWSLRFLSNPGQRPNYAVNPDVTYLADGSFSIVANIGAMVLGDTSTQPSRGNFEVSKQVSTMFSSASETTLGSLDIKTVDGYENHPVGSIIPSTNFSPVKSWLKNIWPFSITDLAKLSIMELVQAALVKALDEIIEDNQTDRKQTERTVDLTLIIEDNQEIEDEILNAIL